MENSKNLRAWLDAFKLPHPFVIAGPCSAESETQLLDVAHKIKKTDATALRAGIWKPRSRPGNFEGVGEAGLKWLQKAKKETGLLSVTEVATAKHVELALKHEIDILWIGARSTVSPFVVQEIAEALKGSGPIVLVKNPVNPDLALWLGAIERIHRNGLKKIGAVHRGFSSYEKSRYRNNPEWQIAIDLQSRLPDLPLLLDPSHIAGRRDLIFELCQTALDLNYDGLMIETHQNPDMALSDAEQQITPEMLDEILQKLQVRKPESEEKEYKKQLKLLRSQIDIIDNQILDSLGKRMKIADSIGLLKRENNVSILQVKRWNAILQRMIVEGNQNHLSEEFILRLYRAIHLESIGHQKGEL